MILLKNPYASNQAIKQAKEASDNYLTWSQLVGQASRLAMGASALGGIWAFTSSQYATAMGCMIILGFAFIVGSWASDALLLKAGSAHEQAKVALPHVVLQGEPKKTAWHYTQDLKDSSERLRELTWSHRATYRAAWEDAIRNYQVLLLDPRNEEAAAYLSSITKELKNAAIDQRRGIASLPSLPCAPLIPWELAGFIQPPTDGAGVPLHMNAERRVLHGKATDCSICEGFAAPVAEESEHGQR